MVQMEDSSLFPKDAGSTFPSNFMDIIKRIFKRLFRVYAHIYHTHFVEMCNMKAEAHLNTCFKHFIFFAKVRLLPPLLPMLPGTWSFAGEQACHHITKLPPAPLWPVQLCHSQEHCFEVSMWCAALWPGRQQGDAAIARADRQVHSKHANAQLALNMIPHSANSVPL
jgi:Mob1/phocein family